MGDIKKTLQKNFNIVFRSLKFINQKRLKLIKWIKNYWRPKSSSEELPRAIDEALERTPFFIQIGANDGVSGDFFSKHAMERKVHGILVEPVPYLFQKLKENLKKNENLIFENIAISDFDGEADFFSIRQGDYESKYDLAQLGSFNKEVIMKHAYMCDSLQDLIVKIKVRCMTLNSLLNKYRIKNLPVLVIDTEEYDYQIIKQIDLKLVKPKLLAFENAHLSVTEYKEIIKLLKKTGYFLYESGWDTFGLISERQRRMAI